ncbi:hypothetical protein CPLU01_08483 [Colletotrichum plurivorum]|uniref:Uncharacterized protein n=1 Tax=Colletotrichum plurivorum TaxID=2175906 RepID=A0A8H6KCI1_9PEZI|nr:hypothetical protein CPLU01_08483 [Colletotrichum plurivorum]
METAVIVAQEAHRRFTCECTDCTCRKRVDTPNGICGRCQRKRMGSTSGRSGVTGLTWSASRVVYESSDKPESTSTSSGSVQGTK